MAPKSILRYSLFILYFGVRLCAQPALTDTTFHLPSLVDTISTYSMDYKSKPGQLQLETGERENLAKGRSAYLVYLGASPADTGKRNALRLLDGSYSSPSYVEFPPLNVGGLVGCYLMIDLKAVRTIKKVSLFTLGNNSNLRPRAFTIYTGIDTVTMDKVYQEPDNQVPSPSVTFAETNAKFVKIVIDVLAQNNSTVLSEVEVYGAGFLPQGEFYSSVRDVMKNVNFGQINFIGTKPAKTNIFFSFRTGATAAVDTVWSNWSAEVDGKNSLFEVHELRRYIQYRIRMITDTLTTPVLTTLMIAYDTTGVATETKASISPQSAQILKENEFTLTINAKISGSNHGIDTIFIRTPSPAALLGVSVNGNAVPYNAAVTFQDMKIALASTILSDAAIQVKFRETPFLDNKPHTVFLSSKKVTNNPQRADVEMTNKIEGWSIIAVGVPDKLINGVVVKPNPFSPNGDGVNDVAAIQFFLGNIGEPSQYLYKEARQLGVRIYDLTGRLIREIYSGPVTASAFVASNSFMWDGRDDTGRIVRPGVYIYQIVIDSDNGGEQVAKTVVVAY